MITRFPSPSALRGTTAASEATAAQPPGRARAGVLVALSMVVCLAGCAGDGSTTADSISSATESPGTTSTPDAPVTDADATPVDPGASGPATPTPAAPSPVEQNSESVELVGDFCDEFAAFIRAWAANEFGPVELTERYRSLADLAPAELAETLAFMGDANEVLVETQDLQTVPGGRAAYDAAGAELSRYASEECGVELE